MIVRRLASLLLPALLLGAAPAAALQTADGKLAIGAFGSVGYGRTNGNAYGPGNEDGQYDNTVFALSVLGHASERLMVAGQIHFQQEEVEVDWAFAEWKVRDAFRLRFGKAKHPFGNYGEALHVGTLRPFFDLPRAVYEAHIVADGYTGAGVAGFYRLNEDWSLAYDLYGGEIHLVSYDPFDQLFDAAAVPGELEASETRDVVGGRLSIETPLDGLTTRLSAYTGREAHDATGDEVRHSGMAASLEYLGDALTARAEFAMLVEDPELTAQAAYVELAWMFKNGLQLAGRVEGSWTDLEELGGSSPLLRHQEAAVGVNYWFSPDLVVKASYHLVDGNRFAYDPGLTAAATSFEETTHLYVVGAQFSF